MFAGRCHFGNGWVWEESKGKDFFLKKEAKTFFCCFAGWGGGVLLVLLAGCSAQGQHCLLPGQRTMIRVEMFFGRDVAGRSTVSDMEWAGFLARDVTPRFPDGFTVFDARGQWLNPATHGPAGEASKVLLILAPESDGVAAKVQGVADAYKRRFRQDAVGVVSSESCAVF